MHKSRFSAQKLIFGILAFFIAHYNLKKQNKFMALYGSDLSKGKRQKKG